MQDPESAQRHAASQSRPHGHSTAKRRAALRAPDAARVSAQLEQRNSQAGPQPARQSGRPFAHTTKFVRYGLRYTAIAPRIGTPPGKASTDQRHTHDRPRPGERHETSKRWQRPYPRSNVPTPRSRDRNTHRRNRDSIRIRPRSTDRRTQYALRTPAAPKQTRIQRPPPPHPQPGAAKGAAFFVYRIG